MIASFYHAISINDSRGIDFRVVGGDAVTVSTLAFSSFNDTRLFSMSVVVGSQGTTPAALGEISTRMQIASGANITVSSRMVRIQDALL